jgi:hypothetical protein
VGLGRRYFTCPACGQGDFGADRVLGVDGYLTAAARRLACLAGVQQSFARAQGLLAELAGWDRDEETIRRLCHAEAARAAATRAERSTAEAFAAAPGDREPHLDAGKVNTLQGWRDVKVAVFACRERGAPAEAASWDKRDLPAPSVRSLVAAVEEAAAFGGRCAAEAGRLRLTDPAQLNVSGDGAAWIWNLVARHFPGAAETLDVQHGAGHVAEAARRALGEDSAEARAEAERGRLLLLQDGYAGVVDWVGSLAGRVPAHGDGAALGEALNYFAEHQGRLNYALRLRRGQSIGSGLVEGSIKQLVNRRLKQTGARWKVRHVGPLVEFCALANSPEWNAYWNN